MIKPSDILGLEIQIRNSNFVVSGHINIGTNIWFSEYVPCWNQSIEEFKKSDRYQKVLDKLAKRFNDRDIFEFKCRCISSLLSFEEKYEILKELLIEQLHKS